MTGISRSEIRRLIQRHEVHGSVPLADLKDLVRVKVPEPLPSSTGKYIVRLYDGMDYEWMDVSGPLSWEDAVAVWKEKTEDGMERTSFDDIDYYNIFPSDTRMLYDGRRG